MKMKGYIKPTCDIVDVAADEFMRVDGMSVRIFDGIPGTGNYNDYIITDGSEILSNHNNKLWDEEEEESWK